MFRFRRQVRQTVDRSTPGTEVKVRGGVGVKRSRARSGNTGRSGDDDDDALRLAYLTTNLPSNLPVKNRFRFDKIVAMGLWLTFWPTVYIRYGVATSYSVVHRESKKTRHQTLDHNFTNYYPIFKILSLADSVVNLQQIRV